MKRQKQYIDKGKPLDFYDSDLKSDNPDDFLSDHEPPKDIVRERKLLKKTDLFRIYKEIWQIGSGLPKPAKYDEIQVRYVKVVDPDDKIEKQAEKKEVLEQSENSDVASIPKPSSDEIPSKQETADTPLTAQEPSQIQTTESKMIQEYIAKLKNQEQITMNLGLNNYSAWFEDVVESMKKGESSLIILEVLKRDENGMKILDRREFYMFELAEWTTIIDLKQDMNMLKKIVQKGQGNHRCEKQDQVILNYKLSYNGEIVEERTSDDEVRIEELISAGMSSVVWRVVKTMKANEISECQIKHESITEMESEEWKTTYSKQYSGSQEEYQKKADQKANLSEEVEKDKLSSADAKISNKLLFEDYTWHLVAELKQLVRIDDIFSDGSAVKKELLRGNSTSKPDKLSRIFFEIRIIVDKETIYETMPGDFPILTESQVLDFEYLENSQSSWKVFLDELKVSKFLKNLLRRMKKQELAEIICRDPTLIAYGRDYDILMEKFKAIPKIVHYIIKLYNFTEPKSTFSMTIDEKIQQAIRKKPIGLNLIKIGNYRKALKQFEVINGFFELGKFLGQDALDVHPHKLSSLLNSSLCYLKSKNWERLTVTCDKILEIDAGNTKAIYRKALGLQEASEFEKSKALIVEHISKYSESISAEQLAELAKLKAQLAKQQEEYLKRQKKAFSKLFD